MNPATDYLEKCRGLLAAVEAQLPAVEQAADWFAEKERMLASTPRAKVAAAS